TSTPGATSTPTPGATSTPTATPTTAPTGGTVVINSNYGVFAGDGSDVTGQNTVTTTITNSTTPTSTPIPSGESDAHQVYLPLLLRQ
ncbi:MAG: hypothetical protein ACPGWR_33210, partial [Ardenticatenaceae bacterium]